MTEGTVNTEKQSNGERAERRVRPARNAGPRTNEAAQTQTSRSPCLGLRGLVRPRDGWLRQPPAALGAPLMRRCSISPVISVFSVNSAA